MVQKVLVLTLPSVVYSQEARVEGGTFAFFCMCVKMNIFPAVYHRDLSANRVNIVFFVIVCVRVAPNHFCKNAVFV